MKPVSGGDGRVPRGTFFPAVLLLFGTAALVPFVFSYFVDDPFRWLSDSGPAVRVTVLLLVGVFVGITWREHRRAAAAAAAERRRVLLDTLLDSRLAIIERLVEGPDRLKGGLPLEDVMRLLLQAAVDGAGAQDGTIDFFEQKDHDVAVVQTISSDPATEVGWPRLPSVEIPLVLHEQLVGLLTLHLSKPSEALDRVRLHALERFAGRAAKLIERAKTVGAEHASAAYLEASNLVKSRFLTTISHELRTPLTSIIGYTKTLDNHWDRLEPEQKREFVREIDKQGSRLRRLVERILEAARVELQGVVIQPIPHDVRTSVQKALAPFVATEGHRIKLGLPDGPVEAEIDPFVVDQVLSNLVDNALRYTSGDVRVSLDCYRSSVTMSVTDHGDGIDPKQLNLVLEPLYRIDENVQSGTGLGLHIVRTLVGSHGGRGEIRSGSTGTSIAIKLPRTTGSRISGMTAHPRGMIQAI